MRAQREIDAGGADDAPRCIGRAISRVARLVDAFWKLVGSSGVVTHVEDLGYEVVPDTGGVIDRATDSERDVEEEIGRDLATEYPSD